MWLFSGFHRVLRIKFSDQSISMMNFSIFLIFHGFYELSECFKGTSVFFPYGRTGSMNPVTFCLLFNFRSSVHPCAQMVNTNGNIWTRTQATTKKSLQRHKNALTITYKIKKKNPSFLSTVLFQIFLFCFFFVVSVFSFVRIKKGFHRNWIRFFSFSRFFICFW